MISDFPVGRDGTIHLLRQNGTSSMCGFASGDYVVRHVKTSSASCLLVYRKGAALQPERIVFRCMGIAVVSRIRTGGKEIPITENDTTSILYTNVGIKKDLLVIDCISSSYEEMQRLVKSHL